MEPIIKVEGLSFAYTDEMVLQDISFDVLSGEFLSVIGPNGSGKTTLLKLLYRHLSPLSGAIYLNNESIANTPRRNLSQKIAVVSQVPQFHFSLTAVELVLMGRSPHMSLLAFEGREDFEIAREAMALTDVSDFKDRSIFSLSGGELQRVVIANKDKGITIIAVFHDINLASCFSDRVMIMKDGNIHGVGSPEDMITKETLESVYDCQVFVDENPLMGKPRVTLVGG